jgi:ribonuclease HI
VGGWAFVAVDIDLNTYECKGYERNSTNNRMELMAPIMALTELDILYGPVECEVVTDSAYVANGINDWIAKWKLNGWMNSAGHPVKNQELWQQLEAAVRLHDFVGWRHVKGHAGHKWNELADTLAVQARREGDLSELRAHS